MPDSSPSLLGEWRAAGELAQLVADPVYYGRGVARGNGRLVLVLPGLFGNDLYLQPLRSWLRRLGYWPVRSKLAVNAGCPERLSREVEQELERQRKERPGRVALIGHSRGGILARAIAVRLQDQVSHLAVLGSPIGALLQMSPEAIARTPPGFPAVAEASNRARKLLDPDCAYPLCGCPFLVDLPRPVSPRTRVASFYTRDDAVVTPAACQIPGAHNIEVNGTHSGLVCNRAIYRQLGPFLAAEG